MYMIPISNLCGKLNHETARIRPLCPWCCTRIITIQDWEFESKTKQTYIEELNTGKYYFMGILINSYSLGEKVPTFFPPQSIRISLLV